MSGGLFGLCRQIQDTEGLTATDKLVGIVLCLAVIHGRDYARMSLATICSRTSLSERTVQKATKCLEAHGVLVRVRTGRAAMYRFFGIQCTKSSKIVETEKSAGQTRKRLRVADRPSVTPDMTTGVTSHRTDGYSIFPREVGREHTELDGDSAE